MASTDSFSDNSAFFRLARALFSEASNLVCEASNVLLEAAAARVKVFIADGHLKVVRLHSRRCLLPLPVESGVVHPLCDQDSGPPQTNLDALLSLPDRPSTSNPFLCAADFFLQLGSCKEAVR